MPYRFSDNSLRRAAPAPASRSTLFVLAATLVAAAAFWLAAPPDAAARSGEPRELTLREAIELAMEHNDQIRDARAGIRESRASRRASSAQLGPSLSAEANVNRFDAPQTTEFSASGQSGGTELTVQEQTTSSLSLTAAQPLTPLWSLYEAQRIEKLNVEQAESTLEQTRRDVSLQVVEAYFGLLQADGVRAVAEQSVDRREKQLERAQRMREAEQVAKNDVLRAEVGVSRARQQLIEAEGRVEVAGAQLARTIGISQNRPISPATDLEPDYSPPDSVGTAVDRALERRTNLHQAELGIQQAETGVRAARSRLLPQINALASYSQNYGSSFQNQESFFVGASLQWTFWQWGKKGFEIDRARAQKQRARIGRRRLERGIELEVRQAYSSYETSRQSLEVAERAARQAEENFRAERQRYEAQLSTSIDLLDAETQLTETRTNLENARYNLYISAANLRRATGLDPLASPTDNASSSGD